MRSFIYLTFLPTLFLSAFAGNTPDATPLNPEEGPAALLLEAQSLPAGTPPQRSPQKSPQRSPHRSPRGSQEMKPIEEEPFLPMIRHGYKCQRTVYELSEIQATIERACSLFQKNKKTGGVHRYPKISKSEEYPGGYKIIFPLAPGGKIYGGRYLAWGAPGNHFVRIDSECIGAEIVYQVHQKSQEETNRWCRLPNCFSRGGKTYNSCKVLYERPLSGPDYFYMPQYRPGPSKYN